MRQFLILLLISITCKSDRQCMPKDCKRPGHQAKSCFCSCLQPAIDDKRKDLYVSFPRCINATIKCGFYTLRFKLNIFELEDEKRYELTNKMLSLRGNENSFTQKFSLDNSASKTSLKIDRKYIISVTPTCTICDFCRPIEIVLDAKHTAISAPTTEKGQKSENGTTIIMAVVVSVSVCVIIGSVIFAVISRRSCSNQRHVVSQRDNFRRS
ncbi:uncharacterized protein LOC143079332 [Mytilus galloprovincialis]|uniref:uncharacterized protein LOC143079332 n=1 Tax=Mytilus galloprovincialis TaxID=29158 RepID=UPI003F7BAC86